MFCRCRGVWIGGAWAVVWMASPSALAQSPDPPAPAASDDTPRPPASTGLADGTGFESMTLASAVQRALARNPLGLAG